MDLYQTLGIDRNASTDEIKKAYKKNAMKYHPDKNLNDINCHRKFQEITHAHEILSDDRKRSIYDTYGEDGLNGMNEFRPEPEPVRKFVRQMSHVITLKQYF